MPRANVARDRTSCCDGRDHATGGGIQAIEDSVARSEARGARNPMSWFATYVRSSIGAKHIMAITGLVLFGFAIVHMAGHLQMFGGQDMYNRYAHFLQDLWEVKWPVR